MSVPSRGEVAGTGVGGGADRERLALSEQEPGWENSECNNTEGSYTCVCNVGFAPVRSKALTDRDGRRVRERDPDLGDPGCAPAERRSVSCMGCVLRALVQ